MDQNKIYTVLGMLKAFGIKFESFATLFNAWIKLTDSERAEVYAASKNEYGLRNIDLNINPKDTYIFHCDKCNEDFVEKATITRCPKCHGVNILRKESYYIDYSKMEICTKQKKEP